MPRSLRIAYFAHTLRSDWNNGNAHFLRGLIRALHQLGHKVTAYESESAWSFDNLQNEDQGLHSLEVFLQTYSELDVQTYAANQTCELWCEHLRGVEVVLLHEWNPPELAHLLLDLRDAIGYKLLFHDTHHRASSSPEQMERYGLHRFDGILAFGESLRRLYLERLQSDKVWTFHEAADTTVFRPYPEIQRNALIVWVGNWGEGERSEEIKEFLVRPSAALRNLAQTKVFGVRYPPEGLTALKDAGIQYGGYLANLDAPKTYAAARATVHIPRQQYSRAVGGIPTIRVFEALACGIPLVSAPWVDSEGLFGPKDFRWAADEGEMVDALLALLQDPIAAEEQAHHGLETILARHTCAHRAIELTAICEEIRG